MSLRVVMVSYTETRQLMDYPARHWLSAARLSTFIKAAHPEWTVRLRSFDETDDITKSAAELRRNFDVVGLPAYLWTTHWARDIAHAVVTAADDQSAPPLVIVGGPETRAMDYESWPTPVVFVMGQGEIPLLDICEERSARADFDGTAAFGATVIDRDVVYSRTNPRRLEGSSEIPVGVRRQRVLPVGLELYGPQFEELTRDDPELGTFRWYETARGCIYSCSFCGHNTLPFFATISEDAVAAEIRHMSDAGITDVFLVDPILGGKAMRGKGVVELFTHVAPNISLSAYMRPEFLDDEFVDILARANIKELLMGLQTTNPRVPKHVRSNAMDKILRQVPSLARNGVPWRAELIAGLPGDDFAGLRESLRFAIEELRPSSLHVYRLTVIPETALYELLNTFDGDYWLTADDHLRVTGSSSFSEDELVEMLTYAGAVMSLHSLSDGRFATFDDLERQVRRTLGDHPDLADSFATLDMDLCCDTWRGLDVGPQTARAELS